MKPGCPRGEAPLFARGCWPCRRELGTLTVLDSCLLHQVLGIRAAKELLSHPKVGASWEGFVIEQVLASEAFYEAYSGPTHQGSGQRLFPDEA